MSKKIPKGSIVSIVIFTIIALVTIIICVNKTTIFKTSSQPPQTRAALDQTQIETQDETQDITQSQDDGSLTYSTDGNDSANYEDGDTSGTKSEWVKNGDTWQYTFYVDDPDAQWSHFM